MIHSIDGPKSPDKAIEAQKKRLKESCQEFEAALTNYLFKTMRESTASTGDADQSRELYEGMFDQAIAQELARKGETGLSTSLYKELSASLSAKTSAGQTDPSGPKAGTIDPNGLKEQAAPADSPVETPKAP